MEEQEPRVLRTSVVLVEKVSPFVVTPPDRYKGEAKRVYQVSPNARPEKYLRKGAEGIKRKLCAFKGEEASRLKDDPVYRSVVMKTYESVKKALMEDTKEVQEEITRLREYKEGMENKILIRSLLEEWTALEEGKLLNKMMVSRLNTSYAKLVEEGVSWRKCKDNDLYKEVKSLLKSMEFGAKEAYLPYMVVLEEEIEKQTSLPGGEFVAMVGAYLECNKSVHMYWDKENLSLAAEKARTGELMFRGQKLRQWVLKMVQQLSRKYGFGNLGIEETEIASGVDLDAMQI